MLDDLVLVCKRAHEKLAGVSIHSRIKSLREAKKWSMERLADEVTKAEKLVKPLSWQTIQQWENEKSAPKRKRIEVVARLLDTTPAELLGVQAGALQQVKPISPSVRGTIQDLAQALKEVPRIHQREVGRLLSALTLAPDSATLVSQIVDTIEGARPNGHQKSTGTDG